MPAEREQQLAQRILFFDGVCGLCNRLVDHLLRADRQGMLRFAPLQGETAARRLPAQLTSDLNTLVYLRDGHALLRSDAALRALIDLGGWRKAYGTLLLIPRFLRDAAYGLVAQHRYRVFGRRTTCRLPTEAERARFLP